MNCPGGRVRLATGTLYTALARLAAEGHVRLVSEQMLAGRTVYGFHLSAALSIRARDWVPLNASVRSVSNSSSTPATLPGFSAAPRFPS